MTDHLTDLRKTLDDAGLPGVDAEALFTGRSIGNLPGERRLALVGFDADSIQRTLLASPRPVTIAGASSALQDWDRALASRSLDGVALDRCTVLFAGGGNAVLVTPFEKAEDVANSLKAAFQEGMISTATTAILRVSPKELVEGPAPLDASGRDGKANAARLGLTLEGGGGFGACISRLAFLLQTNKVAPRAHPLRELRDGPWEGLRCAECGDRPRTNGTRSAFAEGHRKRGRKNKQDFDEAQSFEDIFKSSDRIAFLCLDGRGVGAALAEQRTMSDYVAFSDALTKAFRAVRDPAQRDALGLSDDEHQVILAGGDDLLLVVPANGRRRRPDVFSLAVRLLALLEAELGALGRRIGFGVGIVITKGLPASAAFDYARRLCGSAKTILSSSAHGESAIDFEIVLGGSPLSESIADLRSDGITQAPFTDPLGASRQVRFAPTQRPFKRSRFERLVEMAVRFDGMTSILMNLRQAFSDDPATGLVHAHYQLARSRSLREAFGVQSLRELPASDWVYSEVRAAEGAETAVFGTAIGDLIEATRIVGGTEVRLGEDRSFAVGKSS